MDGVQGVLIKIPLKPDQNRSASERRSCKLWLRVVVMAPPGIRANRKEVGGAGSVVMRRFHTVT